MRLDGKSCFFFNQLIEIISLFSALLSKKTVMIGIITKTRVCNDQRVVLDFDVVSKFRK